MSAINQRLPIILALATDRKDQGRTENYVVYAGGGQVQMKNKRGEMIVKNTILGGNGTVYIANELAGTHEEWVLMPRVMWEQQRRSMDPMPSPPRPAASQKRRK